jgi:L-malate glycosyltransferase
MRIIYLTNGYTAHDYRFLAALAKTRHEVHFLRLESNEPQREPRAIPPRIHQPLWAGGRNRFRWRNVPRLTRDLTRVVHEVKPDLIHAGPIQTAAFIAVRSGFRPVLAMSWGFDLQEDARRGLGWSWVTRYTLRRSTYFTCDAQSTRDIAQSYGMKADRISVFPWGVDLKRFRPRIRSRESRPPLPSPQASKRAKSRPFVLLCNRSWEPRYGVDILAKAFVIAAQRNPQIRLALLGAGSEAPRIRQVLQEGKVLERIRFGGYIPQTDLPRWYHDADLFISPSHVDGSSVSLMEALACGVPALVSDIPANREWVEEGVNGWLFPDGDAEALAAKILSVAAKPRRLPGFSRRARRVAEERANWDKNFHVLLQSYEEAVRLNAAGQG